MIFVHMRAHPMAASRHLRHTCVMRSHVGDSSVKFLAGKKRKMVVSRSRGSFKIGARAF